METEEKIYIPIEDVSLTSALFGQYDENIRVIEDEINVRVSMEAAHIVISGEEEAAALAGTVINRLIILLRKGERIDKSRIRYAIELAAEGRDELIEEIMSDVIAITYRDALYEMMGMESYQKLAERGVIEVAPLAYMRGRTLNEAFVILDEAQNTTIEQMKMFLTRLGDGSRMVVTGDLTQVDLPPGKLSGLKHASQILEDVKDIAICQLTHRDVVRHELVQNIIKAYDKRSR